MIFTAARKPKVSFAASYTGRALAQHMVHRQRRLCAEQQHRHGRRSTCTCSTRCTQSCVHRLCTEQHKDEHEAQAGMHAGCSTLTRLVFCSTRFLRVRWDAARASRRTKPSTLWLLPQSPWPYDSIDDSQLLVVVLARALSILLRPALSLRARIGQYSCPNTNVYETNTSSY
jgi:hypothetical protein